LSRVEEKRKRKSKEFKEDKSCPNKMKGKRRKATSFVIWGIKEETGGGESPVKIFKSWG